MSHPGGEERGGHLSRLILAPVSCKLSSGIVDLKRRAVVFVTGKAVTAVVYRFPLLGIFVYRPGEELAARVGILKLQLLLH